MKVVAFDAPTRIVDDIKTGLIDLAIAQHPAEIGYYGVVTAYAALTRPINPRCNRHWFYSHGQV